MKSFLLLALGFSCVAATAQEIRHVDASTPAEVQIRILKSAAPKEVSEGADIFILSKTGYELAVKGSNGFSCVIERETPDTMEPECYDAEGTRTTLRATMFIEEQRAKGASEQEIERTVKQGYKAGKFRAPSKPGIVYMLSEDNYVLDPEAGKIIHFPGHT
jgi:hypothetical protein